MAIEDLKNQLELLLEHGAADLQLPRSARDAYIGLIEDYRDELQAQRNNVDGIQDLYGVGTIPSACLTETQLELNATVFCDTIDKCVEYLNAFIEGLDARFNRMQAEDQAG